jgi:hypothetical protein
MEVMNVFTRLSAAALALAALAGTQAQADPMIYSAHGTGYGSAYGGSTYAAPQQRVSGYGYGNDWLAPVTRPVTSTVNWLASPIFGGNSSYRPVSNYQPVSNTTYRPICGPNGCYQPAANCYGAGCVNPACVSCGGQGYVNPVSGACPGGYCPPATGGYGGYTAPRYLPGTPYGQTYTPSTATQPATGWPTFEELTTYRSGDVTAPRGTTVPVDYRYSEPAGNSPFYR